MPDRTPGTVTTPAAPKTRAGSFFSWLAYLQVERPGVLLALAAVSVLVAGLLASKLQLRTSFGELLPANKTSVIVADEVARHLKSVSTLLLVADGSDNEGLKRFAQALKGDLEKIDRELVANVEIGVHAARDFFAENKALYAKLETLREIDAEITERYDYEVQKRAGMLMVEEDAAPAPLTEASLRERLAKSSDSQAQSKAEERYPDGYYLDVNQHTLVVLVHTPISSGDLQRSDRLKALVSESVQRVQPTSFDPALRVGFSGNLITSAEEYKQIKNDLSDVGIFGVGMIAAVVMLFYLRFRTLFAMLSTVTVGTVWTFGMAYVLVGHLNSSTGFLVSIVVGNGINFGIIFMARYLEARRNQDARTSIALARKTTWVPTLSAAGTAMAAYGSLVVTDFRGFKHFGVIGGSGMLLCWIVTYLFMPPLLMVMERVWPISMRSSWLDRLRANYGKPFAYVALGYPRVVSVVGLLITLGMGGLALHYLADPMEYDMANIRNKPNMQESEAKVLGRKADKIVGRQGQDGVAIMVPRPEQAPLLKTALHAKRDSAPADAKPFSEVLTLFDLLPSDQEQKLALIKNSRSLLEKARERGFIAANDWKKLEEWLPAADMRPIGIADLPEQVARSFIEQDGTRGRLVYIVPASGRSVWDAHYLIEWANSFRSTTLSDGTVVKGSGQSVIFADMILTVIEDAPKALILSLLATFGIVFVAFRGRSGAWWVMGTLAAGFIWMLGVLAIWNTVWPWQNKGPFALGGIKLNFLNFVALPITVGVGADYAVNVMQRFREFGHVDLKTVVVETGGAVILCSLTTILGYWALTFSVNQAIQSFGIAAAVGEICCMLTAVLVLPALLNWVGKRQRQGAPLAKNEA